EGSGPRAAGAVPGRAACGGGGTTPTVTAANVGRGRVGGDLGVGGTITLQAEPALRAVTQLADALGLSADDCARGIVEVAVQQMVSALSVVSVERGVDPRPGLLIAFGGAGPLHACAVADGLGMDQITCPATAGVLAALGMVVAGERRDHVQSVLLPSCESHALRAAVAPLVDRASAELPAGRIEVRADCRYAGQSHALTVEWDPGAPATALEEAFHAAHDRTAGQAMRGEPVEVVSVRVAAVTEGPPLDLHPIGDPVAVHTGPTSLPMRGSTCWVAEGWRAAVHADGTIRMTRG
ncbi:MAG: hydantoinase/oxoprolinase family protein, partial [Miltoncostaeaceae bacterium]